ncbi:hypothetical protein DF17_29955 [Streptomyces rimosus]|nr:hypothetical protein DF17_29955 [Streptomyces rimosus]KEF22395.1 hypothetical protein DF18_03510 [Streptomyces rimosus]
MYAGERRPREGARDGSGGDDDAVGARGADRTAVVDGDRTARGVQCGGPGAEVSFGGEGVLLVPVAQPEVFQLR